MIYTIGYKKQYDAGIEKWGAQFEKMGEIHYVDTGEFYKGGSVWETEEKARAYLAANQPRLQEYEVYGILADWNTDTKEYKSDPKGMRRLTKAARIVKT